MVTVAPAGTVRLCGVPVKAKVWLMGAAARGEGAATAGRESPAKTDRTAVPNLIQVQRRGASPLLPETGRPCGPVCFSREITIPRSPTSTTRRAIDDRQPTTEPL